MDNDLKYEERLVAFIDLLGFKQLVSESRDDLEKLRVIHDALHFLKGHEDSSKWGCDLVEIEECAQKRGLDKFPVSPICTCFSDCITVSVSTDSKDISGVTSTLISKISYIGAKLLSEGILIRGAITIGELIHTTDGVVFGQALIDAYELERSSAVYPRIILSDRIISCLNYPILRKSDRYPYHQYVSRFDDGYVGFTQLKYFEVLQSWRELDHNKFHKEFLNARNTIVCGLNQSAEKSGIYSKYQWLKSQYLDLRMLNDGVKEPFPVISSRNIHHLFSSVDPGAPLIIDTKSGGVDSD